MILVVQKINLQKGNNILSVYFKERLEPLFILNVHNEHDSSSLWQMKKIGLISDTHGYLDENVLKHFQTCDEIWHAGDFGSLEVVRRLATESGFMVRGVYGNIDGQEIRSEFPEQLVFICEQVKVMIRHIGGYPPKYNPETKKELLIHKPQLFISGHSHILKVIYDPNLQCLHMNPGAAGKQGWQKVRTIIRFEIDGKDVKNCEVIELGSAKLI